LMEKHMAVISFTGQGQQLAQKLMAGLRRKNKASENNRSTGSLGRVVTGYTPADGPDNAAAKEREQEPQGSEQDRPGSLGSLGSSDNTDGLQPFAGLGQLVQELWPRTQALIFIGACGIAVRAIAPHVQDKSRDPAVLVLDEKGQFVIALLSGHIGGANRLALEIAELIGAQPVITTATDINHVFAADSWAIGAGLHIANPQAVKKISASLLRGQPVGLSSQYPIKGPLPAGVEYCSLPSGQARPEAGIYIGANAADAAERPFAFTLSLMPKNLILGCGCRRGATKAQINEAALAVLRRHGLSASRLCLVSSIDLKIGEKGLLEFGAEMGLPLAFFSAAQLAQVPGLFSSSAYVENITGVDNVCERSAVLGGLRAARPDEFANDTDAPESKAAGRLLVSKTAFNGVTIAVYERDFTVMFS
jgi:cobalamin biosynthesis protein CbiG